MRNVILASILVATTATVIIYQRTALARTRQETNRLVEESRAMEEKIHAKNAHVSELEEIRKRRDAELLSAREKLDAQKPLEPKIPLTELNVQAEGQWPDARPYFYLAKKHLPGIDYDAFRADASLSREAAATFGMSPGEKQAVNQSFSELLSRIREVELQGAYLTNTTDAFVRERPEEKISVFVPGVGDIQQLRDEFAAEINSVLGSERAALFLEKAREAQGQFESFSGKDRVITFIPKDHMSGEVIVSEGGSTMFNNYDFSRTQDFMLTQYGHLLERFVHGAALP